MRLNRSRGSEWPTVGIDRATELASVAMHSTTNNQEALK